MVDAFTRQSEFSLATEGTCLVGLEELTRHLTLGLAARRPRGTPPSLSVAGIKPSALPLAGQPRHERPEQVRRRTGESVVEPDAIHSVLVAQLRPRGARATMEEPPSPTSSASSSPVVPPQLASAVTEVIPVRAPVEGDAAVTLTEDRESPRRSASALPADTPVVASAPGESPSEGAAQESATRAGPSRSQPLFRVTPLPTDESGRAVLHPLVWHDDVWLSTATQQALRDNRVPEGMGAATKRVEEDMRSYQATFHETTGDVMGISALRPNVRGVVKRFVVPTPASRPELVVKAHLFGHRGVFKTCAIIEDSGYSWVGMQDDVEVCVSGCTVCQRSNSHAVVHHAAQAIPIPAGVFDRVHMDLLELPESDEVDGRRFSFVFLCVCALSKYPVAIPLENKKDTTVARALWQVICTFGPPTVLVSDNGAEFVNKVIAALANLFGVERRLISAYHPQSNGQVERFNRSLKDILMKCSGDAPRQWPAWLDYTMMVLRSTVHSATGYAPHHIMFGREPRPLADYMAIAQWEGAAADGRDRAARSELCHLANITTHVRTSAETRLAARTAATRAQDGQRAAQDKAHKVVQHRLSEGDWVWLREEAPACKLVHRFVGPFRVLGDCSGGNYRLADEHGVQLERSFPRDKLFLVASREIALSRRQSRLYSAEEWISARAACSEVHTGPLGDPAEDRYVVESILERRAERTGTTSGGSPGAQVLVKWANYSTPTWIPESYVDPDALPALLRNMRRARLVARGRGSASSRLKRVVEANEPASLGMP